MGGFSQDTIETLKTRADIVEVVSDYVHLRRTGRNYVGLCPFHNERTPSFTVSRERGFFHCFGCGAGGTVFTFVMRIEGLDFPQAVRFLARRYGIELRETRAETKANAERELVYRAVEFAHDFFANFLWSNNPEAKIARQYLENRGISAATAEEFRLGFAPKGPSVLAAALRKHDLLEGGIKAGLVRSDGRSGLIDMFRSRLIFPIHDTQGRAIAFGGRLLEEQKDVPKYLNSPDSPTFSKSRALFGIYQARRAITQKERVVVVEGYMDVLALSQAGIREVVATLGTALSVDHLRALSRYTRNVIACFDGDKAGRAASLRALPVFLRAGLVGRAVLLPEGLDPDELVARHGVSKFCELLANARLLVELFAESELERSRSTLEQRASAARRVAEVLRMVNDPFEFDLLARRAAEILGVSELELRREGRKPANKTSTHPVEVKTDQTPDAVEQAQIGLLAAALTFRELRERIAAEIAGEEFSAMPLTELIREVCSGTQDLDSLKPQIETRLSVTEKALLGKIMVEPMMAELKGARRLVSDWLLTVKRSLRDRALRELKQQVEGIQARGDHLEAAQKAQALIELARATKNRA